MAGNFVRIACRLAASLAVVVGVTAATSAQAERIHKQRLVHGVSIPASQCQLHGTSVWVMVGRNGFCIRYYISTVGGQGRIPVAWFSGDKLGRFDAKHNTFPDPGAGDIDTADLQAQADSISRHAHTTAIYVARLGIDGSSGFHGVRRSWLELYAMHAALNVLRSRYGFVGFHIAGQSGGGTLVAGLLATRTDIVCAVPGSGHLAHLERRRPHRNPMLAQFDPIAGVPRIIRNRPRRIIVLSDPQDRSVKLPHQAAFVRALRAQGYPVEFFAVTATDDDHHGLNAYSRMVVGACARGMSHQEVSAALARMQKQLLARAREQRQRRAGG